MQAAVELVQKRMRQFDGSFLQFRCDENGFLSICAFGLPGKTHEDGPARAIQVTRKSLFLALRRVWASELLRSADRAPERPWSEVQQAELQHHSCSSVPSGLHFPLCLLFANCDF